MGIISDLLQGVPANAVLRERAALLDEKYQISQAQTESLQSENKTLQAKLEKLERENRQLKEQIQSLAHTEDLHEMEIKLLVKLWEGSTSGLSFELASVLGLSLQMAEYHLQKLIGRGFLLNRGNHPLTQKGREYLIEKKLV